MGKADHSSVHGNLEAKFLYALRQMYHECTGSFACLAMIDAKMIVGFRDPHGIKPLILGQRRNNDGSFDYLLASESVALEKLDFQPMRDISPGVCTYGRFLYIQLTSLQARLFSSIALYFLNLNSIKLQHPEAILLISLSLYISLARKAYSTGLMSKTVGSAWDSHWEILCSRH